MIREGKKLPAGIEKKLPKIIDKVSQDPDMIALYTFGSLAEGKIKPLSDLDFAVLLSDNLDRKHLFDKHIDLIGTFNDTFKTDEIDLVLLNHVPLKFAFNVIKTGKLLYCREQKKLIDFIEHTMKLYLDFKFYRDDFDRVFIEGIDYRG